MTNQKRFARLALVLFVITLSACAAGPNPSVNAMNDEGHVAGFWMGLWQGMISPITFIISLFTDSVHIYEVHNTGGWYNFGFLLGVGAFAGGSTSANRR